MYHLAVHLNQIGLAKDGGSTFLQNARTFVCVVQNLTKKIMYIGCPENNAFLGEGVPSNEARNLRF